MQDISGKLLQTTKNYQSIPPVDQWNPELCEGVEFSVDREGDWFYMGSKIKRQQLVTLFCKLLRKFDDNQYYCVTPAEKVLVKAYFAPMMVISITPLESENDGSIKFECTTKCEQKFEINNEHHIALMEAENGKDVVPIVNVRARLWAFFSRNSYYHLSEYIEPNSDGVFFLNCGPKKIKLQTFAKADLP